MEVTLTLVTPAARVAAAGKAAVADYRNAGCGSNRTQWGRLQAVLTACMAVVATGKAVEGTADFAEAMGGCAAYNLVHRPLSTDLVRPYWNNLQVYALRNIRESKGQVTGESSTTAKTGVRLFIGPPKQ